MEKDLFNDADWQLLEDEVCRVTEFTSLDRIADGDVVDSGCAPYAAVSLESPRIPKNTTGFITHKTDFQNLSAAFAKVEGRKDREILIRWSKKKLRTAIKRLAPSMPRLWVLVCKEGAYEILTKQKKSNGAGKLVILDWKPDVFES